MISLARFHIDPHSPHSLSLLLRPSGYGVDQEQAVQSFWEMINDAENGSSSQLIPMIVTSSQIPPPDRRVGQIWTSHSETFCLFCETDGFFFRNLTHKEPDLGYPVVIDQTEIQTEKQLATLSSLSEWKGRPSISKELIRSLQGVFLTSNPQADRSPSFLGAFAIPHQAQWILCVPGDDENSSCALQKTRGLMEEAIRTLSEKKIFPIKQVAILPVTEEGSPSRDPFLRWQEERRRARAEKLTTATLSTGEKILFFPRVSWEVSDLTLALAAFKAVLEDPKLLGEIESCLHLPLQDRKVQRFPLGSFFLLCTPLGCSIRASYELTPVSKEAGYRIAFEHDVFSPAPTSVIAREEIETQLSWLKTIKKWEGRDFPLSIEGIHSLKGVILAPSSEATEKSFKGIFALPYKGLWALFVVPGTEGISLKDLNVLMPTAIEKLSENGISPIQSVIIASSDPAGSTQQAFEQWQNKTSFSVRQIISFMQRALKREPRAV